MPARSISALTRPRPPSCKHGSSRDRMNHSRRSDLIKGRKVDESSLLYADSREFQMGWGYLAAHKLIDSSPPPWKMGSGDHTLRWAAQAAGPRLGVGVVGGKWHGAEQAGSTPC